MIRIKPMAILLASLCLALCVAPGMALAAQNTGSSLSASIIKAEDSMSSGTSVPTGSFALTVGKRTKQALQVSDTNATMSQYKGTNGEQRFFLYDEGNGMVSIQSVTSGKFLSVQGSTLSFVNYVEGDESLLWKPSSNSKGYAFRNVATGKRLSYNGKKVSAGKTSTRWTLRKRALIPNSSFVVVNAAHGRALDIRNSSFADGANIRVAKKTEFLNQAFAFQSVGGGAYEISSTLSDKGLALDDTNVEQGANGVEWVPSMSKAGGIIFTNAKTGKVLGADFDGSIGDNVSIQDATGAATQLWTLVPSTLKYNEAVERAADIIEDRSSKTAYYITVDKTAHWLTMFKGEQGEWVPMKAWIVSIGNSKLPTPEGNFKIGWKGKSFGEEHGYSVYYYTNFAVIGGLDFHFHSVKYFPYSNRIKDGRLGKNISWGCVRMTLENAKWLQKKAKRNSAVKIYK